MTTEELKRFMAKIAFAPGRSCWTWIASRFDNDYGCVSVNGKSKKSHRVMWEIHNGREIPAGLDVLHTCDNPSCVRPDHLFLGNDFDNQADCRRKGRFNKVRNEDHPSHKLSDKDVDGLRSIGGIFTQDQLAEMFGIGQAQVSRLLNYQQRIIQSEHSGQGNSPWLSQQQKSPPQ